MAKKTKATEEVSLKVIPVIDAAEVPSGYQERTDDVKGFFNEEYGAIHFIPVEVKAMDSDQDPEKPSCLIFGRLYKPCMLDTKQGDEKVQIQGEEGDIVGVWYKPGMKALRNLGGEPTWMHLSGYKDTGKRNPMAVYTILSAQLGSPLPLAEDLRRTSKAKALPFQTLASEEE